MKNLFLSLYIPAFFILGCKFDDYVVEKPEYFISDEINSFFNVPSEGSIYIFKDSASGDLDSTIVIDKDLVLNPGPDYLGEGYSIEYTSTKTDDFRIDVYTTDNLESFRLMFTVGTWAVLRWDKQDKKFVFPSTDHRLIDSVSLNGTTYYDILEIYNGGLHYNRLWFAKDVGLILKDVSSISQDSVFELFKHQIR
jgi:hypothetical protein